MLTETGVQVAILDLPGSNGPQSSEALDAHFVACDIIDHEGTVDAVARTVATLGALHIGVNVAAGRGGAPRRVIDADAPARWRSSAARPRPALSRPSTSTASKPGT